MVGDGYAIMMFRLKYIQCKETIGRPVLNLCFNPNVKHRIIRSGTAYSLGVSLNSYYGFLFIDVFCSRFPYIVTIMYKNKLLNGRHE